MYTDSECLRRAMDYLAVVGFQVCIKMKNGKAESVFMSLVQKYKSLGYWVKLSPNVSISYCGLTK